MAARGGVRRLGSLVMTSQMKHLEPPPRAISCVGNAVKLGCRGQAQQWGTSLLKSSVV